MPSRIGAWIIGAYGNLAATTIIGTQLLLRGLSPRIGLVTDREEFSPLGLVPLENILFGGCDIREKGLFDRGREISTRNSIFPQDMLSIIKEELAMVDSDIQIGTALGCGKTISELGDSSLATETRSAREVVCHVRQMMRGFKQKYHLDDLIVVNCASTEPPLPIRESHKGIDSFERLLDSPDEEGLSASLLYAYSAIQEGFPYINFTPSPGSSIPALCDLAERHSIPHYGNDGKTGETLVKTVLAPMFLYRNLTVLSWESHNILGNTDGKVLSDPRHKEAKLQNKERVLGEMLGYPVHSHVSIDYVPSLDDWKTAWDFIHFEGFLGVRMSMQFIWQGCDSILAAPLILDLIRLAEFAHRRGEKGLMTHLACFFKDPMGVHEHRLSAQFERLCEYARQGV